MTEVCDKCHYVHGTETSWNPCWQQVETIYDSDQWKPTSWLVEYILAAILILLLCAEAFAADCEEFRDTKHTVDACYRAEHFYANGETLDLMTKDQHQKFDEWFNRKQDCLNQFCNEARSAEYPLQKKQH
jgi:hypothetical protein